MLRVEETDGFFTVYEATSEEKKHNSHVEDLERGVPGQIRALLTPTKLALPPKKMRGYLRNKGISIDADLKKSLGAYQKGVRKKAARALLGDARRGTFGALSTLLEKHERDYLIAQGGFTEHTPYLLGEALVVPETGMVTMSFSSENLLLNAYRQSRFGLPQFV